MSIFARLSLANRGLIGLATIAIIAFGAFATTSLRQELIPSLQLPMAITTTNYAGASPEIVDREVTVPVEQAISSVDGLESTTATSSSGVSVVQAEFSYGTDLDQTVQELERAVGGVSDQLPSGVDPEVFAGSFDDVPVVLLAASSDLDEQDFAQRLEDTAVPELAGIEGVRDVEVTGARSERLTIDLDEEALAAAGLSTADVTAALEAGGVSIPGGDLTQDDQTLPVDIGTSFASVSDVEALPILPAVGAPEGGTPLQGATEEAPPAPVQLGDVANVELGLGEPTSITRTDGEPTIGLSITKETDGNTVGISHDVETALSDLEESLGDGSELTVVFDQAPFIEESIEGLTTEGSLGLAFAVLVILVFLLSVRSTLVTAVSIPLSLLVAMIGLYSGGYTLNILTLAALTISVGRVVDDSIVVLENIKRHLGYGESKREAILTGVREVAGAITAATLTTVGVFLPIAFVGGQAGELFRPFSVTVAIALLASLFVSLMIIPVLAYWFMRRPVPSTAGPEEEARIRQEALAKERRNPLQRVYVPIIRWTTRHRLLTLLAGVVIFAGTVGLTPLVTTNFLDESGQNTATINQTLPAGSSLQRTDAAVRQVEDVLADDGDGESYQVTIGSTDFAFFGGGGSNEATFSLTTDPDVAQNALLDRLRGRLDELDDAGEIRVVAGDAGGPGASDIEVIVEATETDVLAEAAAMIEDEVADVPGAAEVANNFADDQPAVRVVPDRDELAAAGLTEAQVGAAVRAALEGQQGAPVLLDGQQRDVVLRAGDAPASLGEIEALSLPTPTGDTVTVGQVAEVREVEEPVELTRTDGRRTATVSVTPDEADVGGLTQRLEERLADLELPAGASYEIGGVSADQQEAFAQLGVALVAAIVIVFLVMVATFKSLVQPLILLVSIPFAATGALGALLLTDTALGVPALIGLLMLVGIVVTNAIVLIDLINQYRDQGRDLRVAVVEGGRQRLRPILMTALATIFALFPMSLGLTGGGVFISQPLAIVVIGGLISSTLLTLILVPTLYTMVEGWKERRAARRAARSGEPERRPGRRRSDSASTDVGRHPGLPPGPVGTADAVPAPAEEADPTGEPAAPEAPEDEDATGEPAVLQDRDAPTESTVPTVTTPAPRSSGQSTYVTQVPVGDSPNGAPSGAEVARVPVIQVEVVVRTATDQPRDRTADNEPRDADDT